MKVEKVLVPYNFTPYDQKTLDYIIRTFASRTDVDITLFAAHTSVPRFNMETSPVMDRLKGSLTYLEGKRKERSSALIHAAQKLVDAGFDERRIHPLFVAKRRDIASEIIDLVNKAGYTQVVLNHKQGKATHFFTGNVYAKVINALKNTTVTVVT